MRFKEHKKLLGRHTLNIKIEVKAILSLIENLR